MIIPLLISSFTHMWNLTGFPAIYMDEDIYLRKSLGALKGLPLENDRSNPWYGWLFLSGALGLVHYPESLNSSADGNIQSIANLYLVPRIIIGLLGIIDTVLIYKISEFYYNRRVAFISSIIFASMPMMWLTRYVLLEPIQLPFLLSSVLFALYTKNTISPLRSNTMIILPKAILSGIFLGVCIFTKFPALIMIPLIGFLIFRNTRSKKFLVVWFIPVLLVPLISPLYAYSLGMSNTWWQGILFQSHRESQPLFSALNILWQIDPVMIIIGFAGLIFAIIRRDFLLLFWIIPFIIFLYFIGYVSFFHLVLLFPAFCIGAANLITEMPKKLNRKKIEKILPFVITSTLVIFGLTSTAMLITANLNTTHFEAAALMAQHLPERQGNEVTVITGENRFFWIMSDVFHKDYYYIPYWDHMSPLNKTSSIIMIIEGTFDYWKRTDPVREHVRQVLEIFNHSQTVADFNNDMDKYDRDKYPYTSMGIPNLGIGKIEIKANAEGGMLFNGLHQDK
jgi:hypothetical protein